MRANVTPFVGNSTSWNAPRNAVDITIENARATREKGYNVETRYDVASVSEIDKGDMAAVVTLVNGKKFRLARNAPAAPRKSREQIVNALSKDVLAAFALGRGSYVGAEWFPSLDAYERHVNANTAPGGRHPVYGEALSVYRIGTRLHALLGYTPTVAYEVR
jgi:hypothetical protein